MRVARFEREHLEQPPTCHAQTGTVCVEIRFDFGRYGRMDSGVMRESQNIGPGAGLRFELWWASAAGQFTLQRTSQFGQQAGGGQSDEKLKI